MFSRISWLVLSTILVILGSKLFFLIDQLYKERDISEVSWSSSTHLPFIIIIVVYGSARGNEEKRARTHTVAKKHSFLFLLLFSVSLRCMAGLLTCTTAPWLTTGIPFPTITTCFRRLARDPEWCHWLAMCRLTTTYQQWVKISFHSWLHHGWCLVALWHTFVQPSVRPSEQRINVAINRLQDQRSHADRKRESS